MVTCISKIQSFDKPTTVGGRPVILVAVYNNYINLPPIPIATSHQLWVKFAMRDSHVIVLKTTHIHPQLNSPEDPMNQRDSSSQRRRLERILNLAQIIQGNDLSDTGRTTLSALPQSTIKIPSPETITSLLIDANHSIEVLDELIGLASTQRRLVSQRAADLHNSSKPVFRVPPEIISYILELSTSFSDGPMTGWMPETTLLPLSTTFLSMNLACRMFREVAINAPRCWKNPVIHLTSMYSTSPAVLDTYLQRSKSLFFNLSIYANCALTSRARLHNLLDTLRPHVYRCWRIEVCAAEEEFQLSKITEAIRDFSLVFPSLRSVRIADRTCGEDSTSQYEVELIPFWHSSDTQIESVDIEFAGSGEVVDPHPSVDDLYLPPGLRFLRIYDGLAKHLVIEIARHHPRLEHLDWYCRDEELLVDEKPLELPWLKTFKLGAQALIGGFPPLVAPQCEDLCLGNTWYSTYNDWIFGSSEADMLHFPNLKRLSFVNTDGYPNHVHGFLSCHPTLEEILIRGPDDFVDDSEVFQKECQLFDRLSFLSTTGKSSTSNDSFKFLPAVHTFWYEIELHRWMENPDDGAVGIGVAISNSLRQLLTHRPSLSVKILRVVKNEQIPQELLQLLEQFEGRFFVLNHDTPEWAR
ncbi:hypothetical protein DL93DRAFT_2161529 [Clavulina sp. PMI_390]|nr:hypothetical protein DL93DRAFT_2161529 [Clavulina sp. PMI_390]